MRRVATALIGLALAVLVVGVALMPLTLQLFTRTLSARFSLAEESGLPRQRMLDVAEQVRAFVASSSSAALPETVDGRPGFDASAVSHLADVRSVIAGARLVTVALAIVAALWLGAEVVRRRLDRVAAAMRAGAAWCVALVLIAALAGVFDFEALFTAFHAIFFAAGTWTFASDSLLIQAFPEAFWAVSAAVWAGLVLLGGAVLALAASAVAAFQRDSSATRTKGSSANSA